MSRPGSMISIENFPSYDDVVARSDGSHVGGQMGVSQRVEAWALGVVPGCGD